MTALACFPVDQVDQGMHVTLLYSLFFHCSLFPETYLPWSTWSTPKLPLRRPRVLLDQGGGGPDQGVPVRRRGEVDRSAGSEQVGVRDRS